MAFCKALESLEGRRMFSASAVLVHHDTLIVRGDPAESELLVHQYATGPTPQTSGETNVVFVNEGVATTDFDGNPTTTTAFSAIFSGVKHVVIYGTSANDAIYYQGDNVGATIIGGGGNENLKAFGGPGNVIQALTGNNTITVAANPDTHAPSTNATIVTGTGTNQVWIGSNNFTGPNPVTGTTVVAGTGQDTIIDQGSGSTIYALNCNDVIYTKPGPVTLNGQIQLYIDGDPTAQVYVLNLPGL